MRRRWQTGCCGGSASQAGAATGLMLSIMVMAIVVVWMVAAVAIAGSAKMRAESAADGAALAAAPVTFRPFGASGDAASEAARFARANGAELVSCSCPDNPTWDMRTVEVKVIVYAHIPGLGKVAVRASSRATFDPLALLDGAGKFGIPP